MSTPWGNLRIRLLPINSERIRPEKQKMPPDAPAVSGGPHGVKSRALNSPASHAERQMRRRLLPFLVFGLVLAVGGAVLLVWREYPWLFSKTYVLRVATGPLTNEGGKFRPPDIA